MGRKMIIIGAGAAAVNAMKAIRENDQETEIDVFGEEPFYPYYRLKLSKSLFEQLDEDLFLLQKKEWYDRQRIRLHLGKKVRQIHTERQEIVLAGGEVHAYDVLLLAHGASNNPLKIEGGCATDLCTLRNLSDARRIHQKMESKTKVLNIGGGIQGIETVWSMRSHNKKAVIVELAPRLLHNQLDEPASRILKRVIESYDVPVLTGTKVVKMCGDQQCEGVLTETGQRIDCNMVMYSTGISPNLDIVAGTPLRTERGVLVDNQMRTNIPNIYAAGDIAQFNGRVGGLWSIAMAQGKVAGSNLANHPQIYQPIVPVTVLNAFELSLFSMGCISETDGVQSITEADEPQHIYQRVFFKQNRIAGAIVIGDTSKSLLIKNAIEKQTLLDDIDFSKVSIAELVERLKVGGNG